MRMRSIGTNRAVSVSVRQNPGISNWTSSRRGARRALNTDDDETMIIIGGFKQKTWMSTGDRNKDDWGTWTRRRTRMLTKMRPSSSPSRPSSSPSSDLSLWSVDNDKEEEEDGDENAKGGHQVDTWTDSRNVK